MRTIAKLWMLILVLIIASPLGLIIPAYFKSGAAWGEWGADEIKNLIGYVPKAFAALSSLWSAPIPGYACGSGVSYIMSAAAGILVVAGIAFLIGRFLSRKGRT